MNNPLTAIILATTMASTAVASEPPREVSVMVERTIRPHLYSDVHVGMFYIIKEREDTCYVRIGANPVTTAREFERIDSSA